MREMAKTAAPPDSGDYSQKTQNHSDPEIS